MSSNICAYQKKKKNTFRHRCYYKFWVGKHGLKVKNKNHILGHSNSWLPCVRTCMQACMDGMKLVKSTINSYCFLQLILPKTFHKLDYIIDSLVFGEKQIQSLLASYINCGNVYDKVYIHKFFGFLLQFFIVQNACSQHQTFNFLKKMLFFKRFIKQIWGDKSWPPIRISYKCICYEEKKSLGMKWHTFIGTIKLYSNRIRSSMINLYPLSFSCSVFSIIIILSATLPSRWAFHSWRIN